MHKTLYLTIFYVKYWYFACMCMYVCCIQTFYGRYIHHLYSYIHINQSISYVSCACICAIFLYVCDMFMHVCCAFCFVILQVFSAGKSVSREICTTYMQYAHIHTHTYKHTTLIHTHTCKNTCKYIQFKQGRANMHMGLTK